MASKPKHKMGASDADLPPLEAGLSPVTWSDIHPGQDEPEDWKNDFILLDIAKVMDANYKTFKWSLIMALASAVTTVIVSLGLGGLDKLPFFLQLTLVPAFLISIFYAVYAFLRHMDLNQKAVLATDYILFGPPEGPDAKK